MAKRIQASESLIGKKIKCTDGYRYEVVGINTYGYKLDCGGPQVPANRVIKKGRSFVELEVADPENAYTEESTVEKKPARKKRGAKAGAAKTTRTRKPRSRRKVEEVEPEEKPARKRRSRKAKAETEAKPARRTRKSKAAEKKSPIRKRGAAKDTTLELDTVEIKREVTVIEKKPINKFSKSLTMELREAVKQALWHFLDSSPYDIEIRGGAIEAMYNNATDPNDKSLDGPICRMAFDIVPVEASMEADVADDDMVDDDASGLKFDSNGRVDIAAIGVLDANEMRSLKRNFDKLAKTDVNVGSFDVGQGVLHSKTDSLFVLAGYNSAKNICILIEPETGEIKRIKPAKLVDQCEYIDLTEYFSGNSSEDDVEDDLDSVDPDDLDFDDDDLLDSDDSDEEEDLDEDEEEAEFEDEGEDEEDLDDDELEEEEDEGEEDGDEEDLDFDEDFGDFE